MKKTYTAPTATVGKTMVKSMFMDISIGVDPDSNATHGPHARGFDNDAIWDDED